MESHLLTKVSSRGSPIWPHPGPKNHQTPPNYYLLLSDSQNDAIGPKIICGTFEEDCFFSYDLESHRYFRAFSIIPQRTLYEIVILYSRYTRNFVESIDISIRACCVLE